VVMATSWTPSTPATRRMISVRPLRAVGSPPVRRTFRTPWVEARWRTMGSISPASRRFRGLFRWNPGRQ
jgi:hypothetical protein